MKTLVSKRALGAIVTALVLTACARNEDRPRLLAVDQARISAIDPVVLAAEMSMPTGVDQDADLLYAACSFAPRSDRPRLIAGGECVVSPPNELRID